MADWTGIANMALTPLGVRQISSVDEASKQARLIKGLYLNLRDEVISSAPWKCAMARLYVAADAEPPAFGPRFQYSWPTAPYCLRPWRIGGDRWWDDDAEAEGNGWQVEGRKILTDMPAPLKLHFIARVEDPNLFTGTLATAMSRRIAAEIAFDLTNSHEKEEEAWQQFNSIVAAARSIDSQQGTPRPIFRNDILDSRW